MKIAIIALGSRGDVEPYVALGKGLQQVGHAVRLVTHENFEGLVHSQGLEFRGMRGNVQEVAQHPEMRELLAKGNFFAITAYTARALQRAALQWAEDGLAACSGVDLLVVGLGGLFVALSLAEKLKLPLLQAYLIPFTPTHEFPSVLLPHWTANLGGSFKHLSHHLTRQMIWQGGRAADRAAREQVLGLPALPFWGGYGSPKLRELPILYGFSSSVIPRPRDWEARIHVTGYWFLEDDETWTPPEGLLEFLNDKPKPIYIGFGSMVTQKPEEITALVVEALARSQQRAVLLSGWGGMSQRDLPENVFMVNSIPHRWLFPQMAGVVHHGGAGTTAAGLRAGVPTLITPFFGDQAFWGQRVVDLGVGVAPIPHKRLTAENLAQAIRQMAQDTALQQRAVTLGAKIRAEDGIAQAVAIIQKL